MKRDLRSKHAKSHDDTKIPLETDTTSHTSISIADADSLAVVSQHSPADFWVGDL